MGPLDESMDQPRDPQVRVLLEHAVGQKKASGSSAKKSLLRALVSWLSKQFLPKDATGTFLKARLVAESERPKAKGQSNRRAPGQM